MSQEKLFTQALIEGCESLEIELDDQQVERMLGHFLAMIEANKTFNLTRIVEPEQAAVRHYVDSIALLAWMKSTNQDRACSILDVGTGAGFPAIPIAIANPDCEVMAIDSTGKKIKFVRQTITDLGLGNVQAEHARAEHWHPEERFDVVALRAVGSLTKCLVQTTHLAKRGGHFIAYKSKAIDVDEMVDAKETAARVRVRTKQLFDYTLAAGDETLERSLYVYKKT